MATRMIMSIGYKPCVHSLVLRMHRKKTCAVLTETPAMKVKPGSRNTPKAKIPYKICDCPVSHSVIIDTSGSGTYPNTAINESRLDEQSENPINPHRSTSSTQVFPYWTTALPMRRYGQR
jgi:hypothetical protein